MAVSKSMLVLLSIVAVVAVVNADALDGELLHSHNISFLTDLI